FVRQAELARRRNTVRKLALYSIAQLDPAALDAGDGALNQDKTAFDVRTDDLEILRGHALDTEMTGHLLVLEDLAGILTSAGRTVRPVRDRHAVRSPKAAEIPALHRAGKAFAGGRAGRVDILAGHEMIGSDFGTNRDQTVRRHAEFNDRALGLDLGDGKLAARGLRDVLR